MIRSTERIDLGRSQQLARQPISTSERHHVEAEHDPVYGRARSWAHPRAEEWPMARSLSRAAAVDREGYSSDVVAAVAAQPQDGLGDLVGGAEPVDGLAAAEFSPFDDQGAAHHAGAERVDAHAPEAVLEGGALGRADPAVLVGVVRREGRCRPRHRRGQPEAVDDGRAEAGQEKVLAQPPYSLEAMATLSSGTVIETGSNSYRRASTRARTAATAKPSRHHPIPTRRAAAPPLC